ncbi:hypothetical protein BOTBODRAFT_98069, partial [Botryobasidium botryosum FD-172 SS1]
VPDRPFLILCPPGLVNQWGAELAPWFKKGAVDILAYEGTDVTRQLFWTDDGPWGKSKQRPGHKILVAPFTVSHSTDMQRWCTPGSQVSKDPTEPVVLRKNNEGTQHLLSQDWSLVAIDEIHDARNVNNVFRVCLYLASKSGVCLGLTATPLYTQPSDLFNLGRILRIAAFQGEAGRDLLKEMNAPVTKARRQRTKAERQEEAE